jgi:hypothetical protein
MSRSAMGGGGGFAIGFQPRLRKRRIGGMGSAQINSGAPFPRGSGRTR